MERAGVSHRLLRRASMKKKYNHGTGHSWNLRDIALVIGIFVAITAAGFVAFK